STCNLRSGAPETPAAACCIASCRGHHSGTNIPSAEITPEGLYRRRREFIRDVALFGATATSVGGGLLWLMGGRRGGRKRKQRAKRDEPDVPAFTIASRQALAGDETPTPFRDVTTYNNFYEFGTDKSDPAANAHLLRPRPWTVAIDGEVGRRQVVDV